MCETGASTLVRRESVECAQAQRLALAGEGELQRRHARRCAETTGTERGRGDLGEWCCGVICLYFCYVSKGAGEKRRTEKVKIVPKTSERKGKAEGSER
eukprot:1748558-Pleurochrysis_carterae.AAC.1